MEPSLHLQLHLLSHLKQLPLMRHRAPERRVELRRRRLARRIMVWLGGMWVWDWFLGLDSFAWELSLDLIMRIINFCFMLVVSLTLLFLSHFSRTVKGNLGCVSYELILCVSLHYEISCYKEFQLPHTSNFSSISFLLIFIFLFFFFLYLFYFCTSHIFLF